MLKALTELEAEIEAQLVKPFYQARSREKFERLLEVGLQHLMKQDLDDLNIDQLVKEAGCTVATFYQRFENRDGFLVVLNLHIIRMLQTAQDEDKFYETLKSQNLDDAIEAYVDRCLTSYRSGKKVLKEVIARAHANELISRPLNLWGDYLRERFIEAMMAHSEEIRHPDPENALGFAFDAIISLLNYIVVFQTGQLGLERQELRTELILLVRAYVGGAPQPEK